MLERTQKMVLGGLLAALYIVLGCLALPNVRITQSFIQLLKVLIVAVYCLNENKRNIFIFCSVSLILSFILFPITIVMIYNIPSIVFGCVIARIHTVGKYWVGYTIFLFVNTLVIGYEYGMTYLLTGQNLIFEFQKSITSFIDRILASMPSQGSLFFDIHRLVFVVLILDSIMSSFVVYIVANILLSRIGNIKLSYDRQAKHH